MSQYEYENEQSEYQTASSKDTSHSGPHDQYEHGTSLTTVSNHQETYHTGTSSDDTLVGGVSDDILFGVAGNDHISGGNGLDTAVYSGKLSEHSVSVAANGVVSVVDSVSGRDGNDTLTSVERAKFADSNLAFDTEGSAGQAYRLYKAAFDRAPDDQGLGYWIKAIDKGTSLTSAASGFVDSPEFQATYGTGVSNEAFVNLLYSHALHRTADTAGAAFWNNELNSGHMTRAAVLVAFSESPENHQQVAPLVANGIHYQEWVG